MIYRASVYRIDWTEDGWEMGNQTEEYYNSPETKYNKRKLWWISLRFDKLLDLANKK